MKNEYMISNEELIRRLSVYIQHLDKAKCEIYVDPFPTMVNQFGKATDFIDAGKGILSGINKSGDLKDTLKFVGKIAPVPGGRFAGAIAGKTLSTVISKATGSGEQKLKHSDLVNLVENYLEILEGRIEDSEELSQEFVKFKSQLEAAQKNPPKSKWF